MISIDPDQHETFVLRALGIGDLLTAVPALRGLRRARPDDLLTLAAPAWLSPLVSLIDAVDLLEPCADLQVELPVREPALAVNLHGRGPQSLRLLLSTWPESLLTFRHPAVPGFDGPDWDADEHEVRRWCRLLAWGGIEARADDLGLRVPDRDPVLVGVAVVHPGAASGSRRWPAQRFAAVAGRLSRAGCRVVVTGGSHEEQLAREVVERAGLAQDAVLAGRLGLDELAALVASAEVVVCGDTGLAHLASAYGTRSVLLFGPTPPQRWGPPPGPHTVLWTGRTGDPHADEVDPGLLEIGVADVVTALGL